MPDPESKPRRADLLGPLLRYDLLVATRRGQHAFLRSFTAAVLLITLLTAYSVHIRGFEPSEPFKVLPEVSPREQAAFALWFASACMVVQLIGIFLLTPALVADTVAREKERRTLEFLFVTELTDREIVFGKLGARLAYLVGILLTSLPILALTQLFGGVAISILATGFVYLLSVLFAVGALCMFCSVTASTVTGATMGAYAATLGYALLSLCCLSSTFRMNAEWAGAVVVSAINFLGGAMVVSACIFNLRPVIMRRSRVPRARDPEIEPRQPRPVAPPIRVVKPQPELVARKHRVALPPVSEDRPLLWKEVYLHTAAWGTGATSSAVVAVVIVPMALAGFVALFAMAANPLHRANAVGAAGGFSRGVVVIVTVVLAGLIGLFTLRHATGSVTREREKDTLGSLFLLPCDRETILEAKWLAGFVGWWPVLVVLAGMIFFGTITGGVSIPRTAVLVLSIVATLEFLASLGIWISVVSPNSLRANLSAILCLLFVSVGPIVIANYVEMALPSRSGFRSSSGEYVMVATMPPVAWVRTILGNAEADKQTPDLLLAVLWGAFAYSTGAWLLWRDARRRFNRMNG